MAAKKQPPPIHLAPLSDNRLTRTSLGSTAGVTHLRAITAADVCWDFATDEPVAQGWHRDDPDEYPQEKIARIAKTLEPAMLKLDAWGRRPEDVEAK
jgi:hypothetical protein